MSTLRRLLFPFACMTGALAAAVASAAEPAPGAALRQELRSFATTGTVLHVAAHPDDENTQLITYFARARGYRTAYLSLTRGDGGQNEIGPEFDEKLGVARTQELLAARRLDGGRQFFTRAIDFGYSKTSEETLRFWDRTQVLGDVVRVIRRFRPDVIVTRFSPGGGGTHGHHTASGILGAEAFRLAGDPKAYPEQLAQGLTVWQPKRVVLNGGGFGRGGGTSAGLRLDIGGNDPASGEALGAIAARSRAQHITQGFGNYGSRGGGGPNEQSFTPLGGEPAREDLFDGIDTTWARYGAPGAEVARLTEAALAAFDVANLSANVDALLAIRARLAALPPDALVEDRRAQLDRLVLACLGVTVETIAPQAEVVPDEALTVRSRITRRSVVPVRWVETRLRRPARTLAVGRALATGAAETLEWTLQVPGDTPVSQPYWLREDGAGGLAKVDDPALIGTPENAPAFALEHVLEVGGQTLVVPDEPVCPTPGPKGERRRRVEVIAPVALRFAAEVSLFAPGAERTVTVEATAQRAGVAGRLRLEVPAAWRVSPESAEIRLALAGEKARLAFQVRAPDRAEVARVTAHVESGGHRYSNQRQEINYPHLPYILLQPAARARLVSLEVATRGRAVGYLPGAGDDTAAALSQLGYSVRTLRGADLSVEGLRGLDAVVIGVRAFNERSDLAANLPGLFAYVAAGGTVIAQYNRPNGLKAQQLGPYPLSIQGPAPDLRVTDERAPVTLLAPGHRALTTPNRIGPDDFAGWVQERGAYFPSSWAEDRYEAVLAMSDPGEKPLRGSLLIARHGQGHFVYTGLAFFRQLPAGVPGAYRLFANLVSLGR